MAISPISANFAGSISELSAIQPLDVKDNALLNLLIRDRFVGADLGNLTINPGSFATPATPVTPSAPAPAAVASISLTRVAPGDLITAGYVNGLVDALLALDKRLAKIEATPRQIVPVAPTPPIVVTPVPPVAVLPNFNFHLVDDVAHVQLDAHEFEKVNEIKIGERIIPKAELVPDIVAGKVNFTVPAALFEAGVDKMPNLTLVDTGGAARIFTGMIRPIG